MVLDHTRDFFGNATIDLTDLSQTRPELFLTRWATSARQFSLSLPGLVPIWRARETQGTSKSGLASGVAFGRPAPPHCNAVKTDSQRLSTLNEWPLIRSGIDQPSAGCFARLRLDCFGGKCQLLVASDHDCFEADSKGASIAARGHCRPRCRGIREDCRPR